MGTRIKPGNRQQKQVSILRLLREFPDFIPAPETPAARATPDELERRRVQCRDWARCFAHDEGKSIAIEFTCATLDALAHELGSGVRISNRLHRKTNHLDRNASRLAQSVGREAAGLPLAEALHFVTSLYPALLPQDTRSKFGAYYTPPALTNRLVELLSDHGTDWSSVRVLDPAAGAGAFLIQVADRMIGGLAGTEPAFVLRQLGARLQGMEIDPDAALLAQGALEILLSGLIDRAGQPAPQFVRVCDSLEEQPADCFDIVLGNPPYGRVTLSSGQRARFARSLYGHANLYGIFTDLALRWTRPGGLVAYLTPTSFLAGQYYAALRELLAAEAPPLSIDFVHARRGVFEDVLQETLLAVYRKDGSAARMQIHYLHVQSASEATVTKNGTVALPSEPRDPWLAPRTQEHAQLIECAERMPSRLVDWGYSVSTGPLVWNRFKPQLTDHRAGPSIRPLIWAECVLPDGRFEFRAAKRNHTPYFQLRPGDDWLVVNRPCVLVQRTTAKEQPRRLIAAELPADFVQKHNGVVVENHLNMVRPGLTAKVAPSVVAALLNSKVVDQLFRCMNGSVAVSAFELESLPLPDAKKLTKLQGLIQRGADRAAIEAECSRLYYGDEV